MPKWFESWAHHLFSPIGGKICPGLHNPVRQYLLIGLHLSPYAVVPLLFEGAVFISEAQCVLARVLTLLKCSNHGSWRTERSFFCVICMSSCLDFVLTDKFVEWAQNNGKIEIEHVHHLVGVCCSWRDYIINLQRRQTLPFFKL